MRHRIFRAIGWIACIGSQTAATAGAAQLAGIRPDTQPTVTIVRIEVRGDFAPADLKASADGYYIDLPGVLPRTSGTDKVPVPADDPRLKDIAAAGHGAYTRIAFHTKGSVEGRVGPYNQGLLTVEFRSGRNSAARPAARSTPPPAQSAARKAARPAPQSSSPKADPPPAPPPAVERETARMAESLRVPLASVPRAVQEEAARGDTPRTAPPAPPPPVETATAPAPGNRPATSEEQVEASEAVIEFRPGGEHALLVVLMRQKGYIAFSKAGQPGFALFLLRAPAWEPEPLANGIVSLDPYLVLPMPEGEAGLVRTLRERQSIPADLVAYVAFPEDFYPQVLAQVRKSAAQRGVIGKVAGATLTFDPGAGGVRVDEVRVPKR